MHAALHPSSDLYQDMYRVILIDDHAAVTSALRALLESHSFQVVAIHDSGTDGLAAIREHAPDLVILDLKIPGLGGIEVINRLRGASNPTPVLVLSGADEQLFGPRVLRAGANGFVHKSGDLGEIVMGALLVARGLTFFRHEVLQSAYQSGGAQPGAIESLTEREFEVFRCLANGQSNMEIAEHIIMSHKTVSGYRSKIMAKLGVDNIRDLIDLAREANVIAG